MNNISKEEKKTKCTLKTREKKKTAIKRMEVSAEQQWTSTGHLSKQQSLF